MGAWNEEAYVRRDDDGNIISLEEYERTHKPTGWGRIMTKNDVKLYLICGVGFFIDAYDLFIINLATPIWEWEYYGGAEGSDNYPTLIHGAVNAGANIGNVFGQLLFGLLGDTMGRKFVYGKEMIVAIVGIILIISLPNDLQPTSAKFYWIFGFRILMGIGIGGDYPMSAAIVAERSTLQNRGRMIGFIFSNQGWGNLAGSIVTLILFGCFKTALTNGEYGQLDAIWRLQIGLILVPCFAVLYFRLTMPEGKKYLQSQELTAVQNSSLMGSRATLDSVETGKSEIDEKAQMSETERRISVIEAHAVQPKQASRFKAFAQYFSEWRHLKPLIGTSTTWFLVDISFYGLGLNQSIILEAIGFTSGATPYDTFVKNAYGNLIVAAAGYVPGYFLTIAFIELLGRRWIQIQGFLVTALMFAVISGDWNHNGTGGKFVCFTIAQLFFNFGPNATTFIVPAEAFPSRVRGLAHGFSAASGKLGAILSALLFNYLKGLQGFLVPNILWIFFGVNLLGAVFTFLFVPETTGIDADAVDYQETQEAAAAHGH